MKWKCHIPGKEGTAWEGGFYPLTMEFTEDYPAKPPKASKPPGRSLRAATAAHRRSVSGSRVGRTMPGSLRSSRLLRECRS
jgi:hypothetical protein